MSVFEYGVRLFTALRAMTLSPEEEYSAADTTALSNCLTQTEMFDMILFKFYWYKDGPACPWCNWLTSSTTGVKCDMSPIPTPGVECKMSPYQLPGVECKMSPYQLPGVKFDMSLTSTPGAKCEMYEPPRVKCDMYPASTPGVKYELYPGVPPAEFVPCGYVSGTRGLQDSGEGDRFPAVLIVPLPVGKRAANSGPPGELSIREVHSLLSTVVLSEQYLVSLLFVGRVLNVVCLFVCQLPQIEADGQALNGRRFRVENGDSLGEKEEYYHATLHVISVWFLSRAVHQNYVGADGEKEPFFLSVVLTDANNQCVPQYRAILWKKTVSTYFLSVVLTDSNNQCVPQ
uniref:Uncharacterized protein n=1 Tax=Timema tahoe TaxID=61484 RepID=A0A7R9P0E7_9NEOP|nr:unnamed protein product [Timema tahoe]